MTLTFRELNNRKFKERRLQRKTTMPENNDLIAWMRKNSRAARAARTLVQFFDAVSQMAT